MIRNADDRPAPATRVVLHHLAGTKKAHELCRLVESLYKDRRRLVVFVADAGRAATFDEYLWTFAQQTFVPHALWNGHDALDDPIALVTGSLANPNQADVLLIGDRLAEPQAAAAWGEVHDFITAATEDAGKVEAWKASGFVVEETRGLAMAKPRR